MKTVKELTSREIGEVFCKAADWLEKYKWCQGTAARPSLDRPEEACILGSVTIALGGLESNGRHYLACRARLKSEGYGADWNDSPSRTKEQVVNALRCTAEKCKGDIDE